MNSDVTTATASANASVVVVATSCTESDDEDNESPISDKTSPALATTSPMPSGGSALAMVSARSSAPIELDAISTASVTASCCAASSTVLATASPMLLA
eukprot:CAMPEP_0184437724 /NCGR_PEP_ID=MMETSP0738-20130409/611883_1 /TAXON_ID=385413 /ORGANISM="Thalassiosira miniscula, Strain CCMP1093" /LENGTH=98 /DNA_ID=CAMNT_0026804833 /DNA_START=88 /DNA_END=380 /DNA_ORIENTATION=-